MFSTKIENHIYFHAVYHLVSYESEHLRTTTCLICVVITTENVYIKVHWYLVTSTIRFFANITSRKKLFVFKARSKYKVQNKNECKSGYFLDDLNSPTKVA